MQRRILKMDLNDRVVGSLFSPSSLDIRLFRHNGNYISAKPLAGRLNLNDSSPRTRDNRARDAQIFLPLPHPPRVCRSRGEIIRRKYRVFPLAHSFAPDFYNSRSRFLSRQHERAPRLSSSPFSCIGANGAAAVKQNRPGEILKRKTQSYYWVYK